MTDVTLRRARVTAETDLVTADVGNIVREDVTVTLKKGVGPEKRKELEQGWGSAIQNRAGAWR